MVKLRGNDGIVRRFQISRINSHFRYADSVYTDTICVECGYSFGVRDYIPAKPFLKAHQCTNKDLEEQGKRYPDNIKYRSFPSINEVTT